ncbi:MAG: hypothetical protein WKF94_05880 [Solirubrobacteraceae bacterium]
MDLLSQWRRRSYGAAAAAVIAPVAIIGAALAVGLGGSGLAGLGSLSQAIGGPELPAIAPLAPRRTDDAGRLLARVRQAETAPSTASGVPSTTAAPPAGSGITPPPESTPGVQAPPVAGTFDPGDGNDPAGTPAPTQAPPAATPAATEAAAQEPPGVVDQVAEVTEDVPVAGDVVDALAETVDGLTP